jgi:DNA-directed RNA polymerase specialized sigma24 family protein
MTAAWRKGDTVAVERDLAIDALPAPYGDAILLLDGGASAAEVAVALGIDPDAATAFAAVAEGKLTELLAAPAPSTGSV